MAATSDLYIYINSTHSTPSWPLPHGQGRSRLTRCGKTIPTPLKCTKGGVLDNARMHDVHLMPVHPPPSPGGSRRRKPAVGRRPAAVDRPELHGIHGGGRGGVDSTPLTRVGMENSLVLRIYVPFTVTIQMAYADNAYQLL